MKILRGISKSSPIVVERSKLDRHQFSIRYEKYDNSQKEIDPPVYGGGDPFSTVLDIMFGSQDGSYFIKNRAKIKENEDEYHVFYVEDRDSDNHTIFFLIR